MTPKEKLTRIKQLLQANQVLVMDLRDWLKEEAKAVEHGAVEGGPYYEGYVDGLEAALEKLLELKREM